ncbi:hypothetical protein COO60DRAFT_1474708, partial [Scenedesmus sp. NREL 46B-D3]
MQHANPATQQLSAQALLLPVTCLLTVKSGGHTDFDEALDMVCHHAMLSHSRVSVDKSHTHVMHISTDLHVSGWRQCCALCARR